MRFGEFELSLNSSELRKSGSVVRLQPQPLKALALLVSRAGQTVTREELRQAVWEGETFVDFEHGLNFCINQIRGALGDSAQSPRFIETLPRRGYRFIAEVETTNGSAAIKEPAVTKETGVTKETAEPISFDYEPARPTSARRRPYRLALIGALAVVVVAVGYFVWRGLNNPPPPKSKMMIAVLPFTNLSMDGQDFFSDGMTEEMIARLGRINPQRLGVIARTSVMTYKGANKDIPSIARELNVDYILEGSVRRDGERARITAQLIHAGDQTYLWSESYDRPLGGVLGVQSEVAARIASALAIELLGAAREDAFHSESAEAVDAYLRGRYLLNKGDAESIGKSVEYFTRATEKDPRYAAGFAGLADSYQLLGMYYAELPAEAYPKAKRTALRALELDPNNAEASVALGTIRFRYEWEWEEAERDFLRALEINPSLGMAHHDYAWFLVATGRLDEGVEHIKMAQRLDPLSPLANSDVGWVYLMARRYDEAIEQIKRTLELEPRFGSALACLERAYTAKGQHKEALETLLKDTGQSKAYVGDGDPQRSLRDLYRWMLNRKLEEIKKARTSSYNVATLSVLAGEQDRALEWLEEAFRERDPMLVAVRTDPTFDSLRGDARFERLLKRIGFPR
jgi:TolB-like protein/DNA-binding winged helix-turn-helix (wHTH) protein/Flp pilus assembly protein TadD